MYACVNANVYVCACSYAYTCILSCVLFAIVCVIVNVSACVFVPFMCSCELFRAIARDHCRGKVLDHMAAELSHIIAH